MRGGVYTLWIKCEEEYIFPGSKNNRVCVKSTVYISWFSMDVPYFIATQIHVWSSVAIARATNIYAKEAIATTEGKWHLRRLYNRQSCPARAIRAPGAA